MALPSALVMSTNSFLAGQTPVPVATLIVGNNSAVAVTVTGVDLYFTDVNGIVVRPCANPPLAPIGQGQPTTVAANGGSTTLGPMAIAVGMVSNGNPQQMVPTSSLPTNVQGAMALQQQLFLRARVYGSDGSIQEATPAQFTVSYSTQPPKGYQGGAAVFTDVNDACLLAAVL
jgi:hypothetical protein